jgi:hypothetical protein
MNQSGDEVKVDALAQVWLSKAARFEEQLLKFVRSRDVSLLNHLYERSSQQFDAALICVLLFEREPCAARDLSSYNAKIEENKALRLAPDTPQFVRIP